MTSWRAFVTCILLPESVRLGLTSPAAASSRQNEVSSSVLTPSDECQDKKDCSVYNLKTGCCGIYEAWARNNCPVYCKFCTPKVTVPPLCDDTINNCHEYNADLCTNSLFKSFVKTKCAGFCKLCEKPVYIPECARNGSTATTMSIPFSGYNSEPPKSTKSQTTRDITPTLTTITTTTSPKPKTVVTKATLTIDKCSHAGNNYSMGAGWYTEHCLQWCECVDPHTNHVECGPKKCPNWTAGCDLVFHRGECCPTLKCPDDNKTKSPSTLTKIPLIG